MYYINLSNGQLLVFSLRYEKQYNDALWFYDGYISSHGYIRKGLLS